MDLFHSLHITGSALTANRLRMDVIAANIANANTTRAEYVDGQWVPYRRKMVVMEPKEHSGRFESFLQQALGREKDLQGVKVTQIVEDPTPYRRIYDPDHPDADEEGFVLLPNVDVLKEMVDLVSATRSYEANVTVMNATKAMYLKALEIGR